MNARPSLAALALVVALTGCTDDGGGTSAAPPSPVPTTSSPAAEAPSGIGSGSVDIADRTLARLELPGGPDFLAAADGLLWVKHEAPLLLGLDPQSGEERRRLRVAANPNGLNGNCNGMGGNSEHVWVCAGSGVGLVAPAGDREVTPVTGVDKISDQTSLPVQSGRVWVIEPDGTTLTGLRVADGSDPVRLRIGVRCVDAAAGTAPYLWLACPTDGVGVRVDTATGEALQVPELRGVRGVAAADDVFFSYRSGLARVDQQAGRVVNAAPVAVGVGVGLHAAGAFVWVRGGPDAFLTKVDATSLTVLEQIAAPEEGGGSVLLAYDALWASAYDEDVVYRLRPTG